MSFKNLSNGSFMLLVTFISTNLLGIPFASNKCSDKAGKIKSVKPPMFYRL